MGWARAKWCNKCDPKVEIIFYSRKMKKVSVHCAGCKQSLHKFIKHHRLRCDLGELATRLNQFYPNLPLCKMCYRKLLVCPRRKPVRKSRHAQDLSENIWCDNCFISTKRGDVPCRYFGELRFCEHCSGCNNTRWRNYAKIASLMDREVQTELFHFFKPTHNKSCSECRTLLGPGGSFYDNQFYCAKHSPLIFGLPPQRIVARLNYSDIIKARR